MPRTPRLNDLGIDMKDKTYTHEFDCEGMTAVKAVLQQRVADRLLPLELKSHYFYSSGMGEINRYEDGPGVGHAFIVVERGGMVTGVIEATESSDAYREAVPGISFADFARGNKLIVCQKEGGVYGFEFTHAQAEQARIDAGVKTYKGLMRELDQKRLERQHAPGKPGA